MPARIFVEYDLVISHLDGLVLEATSIHLLAHSSAATRLLMRKVAFAAMLLLHGIVAVGHTDGVIGCSLYVLLQFE